MTFNCDLDFESVYLVHGHGFAHRFAEMNIRPKFNEMFQSSQEIWSRHKSVKILAAVDPEVIKRGRGRGGGRWIPLSTPTFIYPKKKK